MSMIGRSSLWFMPLLTGETETNPQDSGFGRPPGRPKGERQGWRESKCRAETEFFRAGLLRVTYRVVARCVGKF
jgi:hypothetical protein